MGIGQSFFTALGGITANRLRAFLTMLGIIIGVAVVIVMVAIGEGARLQVSQQIEVLGTNMLVVNVTSTLQSRLYTYKDLADLRNLTPSITGVAPSVSGNRPLKYGSVTTNATLDGTTADFAGIRNVNLLYGRFFAEQEVLDREPLVVLGSRVAERLFGSINPIGLVIKTGTQPLRVIGVLEADSALIYSNDNRAFVPITTLSRITGVTRFRFFYVGAANSQGVTEAQEALERAIIARFGRLQAEITSQDQAISTVDSVTNTLTTMLSAIAAISLLVGGIGIMNIMLVSVTERTREIGIRKAIGAKRRDILIQFLIEAMILSVVGGALGIILGYVLSIAIASFAGWPPVVPMGAVLVAVTFSAAVGLFFGLYPANKASKLDPIQALRYE